MIQLWHVIIWSDFHQFTIKNNCFTLWAFAYCLLQASSDWRWHAVDAGSAVLRSERMGMYVEDNWNCPMSRFIVRSCPPLDVNGLPNPSSKFVAVFGQNLALFPFNGMVFLCHMITDSRFVVCRLLLLLLWPGEMGLLESFCFLFVFCFPDYKFPACFPDIHLLTFFARYGTLLRWSPPVIFCP